LIFSQYINNRERGSSSCVHTVQKSIKKIAFLCFFTVSALQ